VAMVFQIQNTTKLKIQALLKSLDHLGTNRKRRKSQQKEEKAKGRSTHQHSSNRRQIRCITCQHIQNILARGKHTPNPQPFLNKLNGGNTKKWSHSDIQSIEKITSEMVCIEINKLKGWNQRNKSNLIPFPFVIKKKRNGHHCCYI